MTLTTLILTLNTSREAILAALEEVQADFDARDLGIEAIDDSGEVHPDAVDELRDRF